MTFVFSPALSAVRIAGQSCTIAPAGSTRTIPRTTSSAPTARATQVPVKSTISGRFFMQNRPNRDAQMQAVSEQFFRTWVKTGKLWNNKDILV